MKKVLVVYYSQSGQLKEILDSTLAPLREADHVSIEYEEIKPKKLITTPKGEIVLDLGQNMVPGIERLYLVGPFQHPGGGVFGAGRASAMKAFDDLGLDVDKLN